MTEFLLQIAPFITAISPVLVIYVTSKLGKKKNRREELLDDYNRMREERDDYLKKWYAAENEIERLKKEKQNEIKR